LKFVVLVAGVTALALGLATVAQVKAQDDVKGPDDGTFALRVCNESGVANVYIAVLSKLDAPDGWRLRGWYAIPNAGCTFLNRYLRPIVYTYARGGGYYWDGNDTRQCINPTRAFDRTVTNDYECTSREISVGFKGREVDPDNDSKEITLR
jgi:uncharacterized membrane protein